ELRPDKFTKRGAVPALSHQKIVRRSECLQPSAKLGQETLNRARMACRLARHSLDNRQQVLRTMCQFAEQESQVSLTLLALGYIDRGARQPDNFTGLVSKRFYMQVMPADPGCIFERHLCPFGLPARKDFAFGGNYGGTAIEGQNFRVRMAEKLLHGPAEHRIADRGITKISVLRVHRHLRAAQRCLVSREPSPQKIWLPSLRSHLLLQTSVFSCQPGQFRFLRP